MKVDSSDDGSGSGAEPPGELSLRDAINQANALGGGTISFNPNLNASTIALGLPLPALMAADTVDLSGDNISLTGGVLTGSGTITNGAASALATLTEHGTGTFSGIIQDGGTADVALTLAGGTLTLSGANIYSGGTNVTAGTLLVTGTVGSGESPSRPAYPERPGSQHER